MDPWIHASVAGAAARAAAGAAAGAAAPAAAPAAAVLRLLPVLLQRSSEGDRVKPGC